MMSFCGNFHPAYNPRVTGFNKQGGEFWIGFIDEDETVADSGVRIELTVWSDDSPSKKTFASIHVHYDGIKALRKLEALGFLKMFEKIQASTFYDVVQCCVLCDIPITYHGGDLTKEMLPRKFYEVLYS